MAETPQEVLKRIKDAVDAYDDGGYHQWYVDEFVIDCDAEEFWRVVERALIQSAAST